MKDSRPTGMPALIIVQVGQFISLLGSAMVAFGVTIWAYQITGKATALAMAGFFFTVPRLVMAPIAGTIVDRSNRKLMMMVSDLAAGLSTIMLLLLYTTGDLQIWHVYVANIINGAFRAFQFPAYSSVVTMMVSKEQYARASGMMSLVRSTSGVFAPMLAGALWGLSRGFTVIMIIDIATLIVAIGTLLFVHIPQPPTTEAGREGKGNILKESAYGFRYIFARPSLLNLQLLFLAANFFTLLSLSVLSPMILASTDNNEIMLSSVRSAGAIGGVAGGLLMSAWGGSKRKIHGVLLGWVFFNLLGVIPMGLGRSLPIWALASFFLTFFVPVTNSSNQAIWQAKVAPDVQGRVFSVRMLIAWFINPLASLAAGPLADYLFEPAMSEGGAWADRFGGLVGTGPGAGMSLMFIFAGASATLVSLGGYAFRTVRNVEDILPDHDAGSAPVAETLV